MLVSTTPIDVLLPRLRDLGAAPVVEAADGIGPRRPAPTSHRARNPRPQPAGRDAAREVAQIAAAVAAVRAGDKISAVRPAGETAR